MPVLITCKLLSPSSFCPTDTFFSATSVFGVADFCIREGRGNFAIKARAEAACRLCRAGAKSSLRSRIKEERGAVIGRYSSG